MANIDFEKAVLRGGDELDFSALYGNLLHLYEYFSRCLLKMSNLTSQGKKEIEKDHKVIEPSSLHQFLSESHKTFFLEKSLSNLFWLTCFRTGSASSTVPSTWCTMVRTGAAVMDQEKHSRQGGCVRWCWGMQSSDLYLGAAGERGLTRKSRILPHVTAWLTTPSVLWKAHAGAAAHMARQCSPGVKYFQSPYSSKRVQMT